MRVRVSIPSDLFRAVEAVARWTGRPRSELYTEALRLFMENRGAEAITEQLNRVYGKTGFTMDPVLSQMQAAVLKEDW